MSPVVALKELFAILDLRTRKFFLLVILLVMLAGLLEGIGVGLVIPLLKIVAVPETVNDIPYIGNAIASLGFRPGPEIIIVFGIGLFIFIALKNALLVLIYYIQNRVVFGNERRMATRLFRHYLYSPYIEVASRNSASLIRNINNSIDTCFKGVLLGFIEIFTEFCIAVSIGFILLLTAPWAALSTVIVLGVTVILYQSIIRRRFAHWGRREHQTQQDMYHALQQGLHSLKTTKAHGREDALIRRFDETRGRLYLIGTRINTVNQTPRLWVETMIILAMVMVIAILLHTTGTPNEIIPVLGLFAAAAFRLMPSINRSLMAFNRIRQGTAALETVIADLRGTVNESPAPGSADQPKRIEFERLVFENVSLQYPDTDLPAIHDLNFEIKAGQFIGIIGPSGAGKTTIVDLMLGLLYPTHGEIKFNDQPLSEALSEWRNSIGYVPQSVYIFDDTVRRNIAFGFQDDNIDDAAIWRAIDIAQLRPFVEALPNGLDSNLGEHGLRMSGGQQQRLGMARAIYHDPDILILDEATSALDLATEHDVWQAIAPLTHKKTIIVIAHRLSTVKNCDQLILLNEGRIKAVAKYDDIIDEYGERVNSTT